LLCGNFSARLTIMTYSKQVLQNHEMLALAAVGEGAIQTRNIDDFKALIRGPVKQYFPHEWMACAIGELFGDDIRLWQVIGVNCPEACLQQVKRITSCSERRIVQRWLLQQRAQVVTLGDGARRSRLTEPVGVNSANGSNLAAFGCADVTGEGGTYFSFAQMPERLTNRHAYKLELLLPFLHQSLVRVCRRANNLIRVPVSVADKLTKRERQVLSLVSAGMSNRAIAEKLSRSESTVQNHLYAIFKKLGVRSRSAAIAHCNRKLLLTNSEAGGAEVAATVRHGGRMTPTQIY
jgi:transcriptional regulator EpsA